MKKAWCEKCKCPLTLLRTPKAGYEKRRWCARCAQTESSRQPVRLVARTSTTSTAVQADEWFNRVRGKLRIVEDE